MNLEMAGITKEAFLQLSNDDMWNMFLKSESKFNDLNTRLDIFISKFEKMHSEFEICKAVNATLSKEVKLLKRKTNRDAQYQRQENIEISGIPATIQDSEIEENVIKILKQVDVNVSPSDIVGCHRLPKRGTVITRFVNRKNAEKALMNSNKLKNYNFERELGQRCSLYINRNLTPEYLNLRWKVKMAKTAGYIFKFGSNKRGIWLLLEDNGRKIQVEVEDDIQKVLPTGVTVTDICS